MQYYMLFKEDETTLEFRHVNRNGETDDAFSIFHCGGCSVLYDLLDLSNGERTTLELGYPLTFMFTDEMRARVESLMEVSDD